MCTGQTRQSVSQSKVNMSDDLNDYCSLFLWLQAESVDWVVSCWLGVVL